jgi:subtilisin family serine protease
MGSNQRLRAKHAKRFYANMKPFNDSLEGFLTSSDRANIRIAVLDSGVDKSDPKIGAAIRIGRIAKLKSWVNITGPDTTDEQENQADWHDTYGHGTHVTKLLLDAAPAAAVYVAKICHKKTINDEFMSGIAEVR